jgi:hypothetical protein
MNCMNNVMLLILKKHKEFECPQIGEMKRDSEHFTSEPIRSEENFHDDYTPLWIKPGSEIKTYKHKWHGWNIIRVALDNKENIIVFDEDISLVKNVTMLNTKQIL